MNRMLAVLGLSCLGLCAKPAAGVEAYPAAGGSLPAELDACNVVWTAPSDRDLVWTNAGARCAAMPLGNGALGINLWVEKDGDLQFYLSHTDARAESARLVKLGKVRITLSPNPFIGPAPFRQELMLRDGQCVITAGEHGKKVTLRVFVDSQYPVIHVVGESESPVSVQAVIVPYREETVDLRRTIENESAWALRWAPFPVLESADIFAGGQADAVVWYHRNVETPGMAATLAQQSLKAYANEVRDPLKNLTFGGWVTGAKFRAVDTKTLRSTAPTTSFALRVAAPVGVAPTAQAWLENARKTAELTMDSKAAAARTAAWWQSFWFRSWVLIDDRPGAGRKTEASLYTRGYMLQQYMNACAGRGGFPILPTGSIFTMEGFEWRLQNSPDWRKTHQHPESDCFSWQILRHVYHTMLAAGDFEMMLPLFNLYESVRPLAEGRTEKYYKAKGAFFPETMTPWGTYPSGDFRWDGAGTPPSQITSSTPVEWNQGPELVSLMLDYYEYTDDRAFLTKRLLPMAESVLKYFDTRFARDHAGHLVIQPTQATKTYQRQVTNDMPTVAGLRAISARLCALPATLLTLPQRTLFEKMKAACPPIPQESVAANGGSAPRLAPAEKYEPTRLYMENPEVYAIWPYHLYGVGLPDLDLARRTYENRGEKSALQQGWGYDGSCAALLGLTSEAQRILTSQCNRSYGTFRWPVTWGPIYDWFPDQAHGAQLMLTTQYMLLQSVGEKIYLLPAWPKDWDVDFKLHAAHQTTVECVYRGGKIQKLIVTPESRKRDVLLPGSGLNAKLGTP